jgi:hypothetical protein
MVVGETFWIALDLLNLLVLSVAYHGVRSKPNDRKNGVTSLFAPSDI